MSNLCPICSAAGVFDGRTTMLEAHMAHLAATNTVPEDYSPQCHWRVEQELGAANEPVTYEDIYIPQAVDESAKGVEQRHTDVLNDITSGRMTRPQRQILSDALDVKAKGDVRGDHLHGAIGRTKAATLTGR